MAGWRRNLYIICAAELVAILGFSTTFPFLPLFIQELGVTELEQVEIWSGLLATGSAVAMAVVSPIWGSLADRFGRKLMVERAMFGGALTIGAMGLVTNVHQLFALRILQGSLTGTVAASTTLVASIVPRDKLGYSLGLIQMAILGGSSLGPLLGGLVADSMGYRPAFWVTGVMLLMAGLAILAFVKEKFEPPPRGEGSAARWFFNDLGLIARSKAMWTVVLAMFLLQVGRKSDGPILPLFVQSLSPLGKHAASTTGIILSVNAFIGALAALAIGRISDRIGRKKALICCILGGAALYAPQALVSNTTQLLALRAAMGALLGGVAPTANAIIAIIAPEGKQGSTYGLTASATALGNAIGPILGATIAATLGIRSVFLSIAAILALVGIWVAGVVRVSE